MILMLEGEPVPQHSVTINAGVLEVNSSSTVRCNNDL